MTDALAIALAQVNPTVGDIAGNIARIRAARAAAAADGAEVVVFPELVVAGYPPEDLVLKPAFQTAVRAAVTALAAETADGGPALVIGAPWVGDGALYNAALVLDGGRVAAVRYKHELPNYGVFDEVRVFRRGPLPGPVEVRGVRLGILVCEDMWFPEVAECLEESGAEILVVINGSPFEADKQDVRDRLAEDRVRETGLPLIYVNQICGQDELVFDGSSFVLDSGGAPVLRLPAWREAQAVTRWSRGETGWRCAPSAGTTPAEGEAAEGGTPDGAEALYQALLLGIRDYVEKNHFRGVLIGLSGGIDSALAAALAVDALGPERVRTVMMPSPYTSRDSLEDAAEIADLLEVDHGTIPIEPAMQAFRGMLAPVFEGRPADVTEENIQSRARGLTLMALSNKLGYMVLSTGNKSEMSVGYATLYGDMCGGYNPLKDVYKTTVYRLCDWRNAGRPDGGRGPDRRVMPERVLTKAPSAELKPDQTDQDTLPPYAVLDDILHGLIEEERPIEEIVARGHDRATVLRVWRMLDLAEYKRRQAPPGVKITRRAFGRDRRYPITNAFRGA